MVPSRGLRDEFLGLLREGGPGLGPPIWGGGGDPKAWGAPGLLGDPPAGGAAGVLGDPKALGGQGDVGDPKAWGTPGVLGDPKALGAQGGVGDPKALGAPGGPGGLRVPNALEPPHGPGVPSNPRVLNALEVPNGLGAPRVPGAPHVLGAPNTVSNGGVPNALEVPNTLGVPKILHDPGVPNALEVPNTLEVPNALGVPKILHDPGVPNALEVPKILHDPGAPNTLEHPNTPGATTPSWDQVVFVLPAFEVRTGARVPGTKAELLQLWGTGDARPFYGALCPRCQAPTAYGCWWALPPTPQLRVAYEAPWRDPWEPFYVGPAQGVPPFDERFLQYGFNRISQACELHVAGFRFLVLDGAFVVHRGFKEPGGFHGGREAELQRNRQLFRRFRAELRQRYPRSPRRC